MKRKYLCVSCAHNNHKFEIPKERKGFAVPDYVLIDGEKWISWHRSPSQKVKCNECGRKSHYVFEPFFPQEFGK